MKCKISPKKWIRGVVVSAILLTCVPVFSQSETGNGQSLLHEIVRSGQYQATVLLMELMEDTDLEFDNPIDRTLLSYADALLAEVEGALFRVNTSFKNPEDAVCFKQKQFDAENAFQIEVSVQGCEKEERFKSKIGKASVGNRLGRGGLNSVEEMVLREDINTAMGLWVEIICHRKFGVPVEKAKQMGDRIIQIWVKKMQPDINGKTS